MSEKLKPNFTAVPNTIFDDVLRTLAPGAAKVLFAICRFTYGFQKASDRISLKQLQDMTGMARGSVARSVKELGSLVSVTPGDPSRQLASEYRLNIKIPDAELVSLSDQHLVSKRDQASLLASRIKRPSKESPKKEDKTGALAPKSFSIAKQRKLTRGAGIPPELQPAISRIVAQINKLAGTHYRDDRPDALKNLIDRLADGQTEAECVAVVEGRHAAWSGNDEMAEYFRPSTLFAAAHFEDYLQAAQRQGHANGTAKPAQVKDLGDGFVEVDGRRMDRQTAERRYGQTAI